MSDVERIKDAIQIEDYIARHVPSLKKAGALYKANCPHHNDKTPSFVVNPETQTFHCYGACQGGGDVIAFAMKHHSLSFGEALEELARYANITLTPLSHEDKAKSDKRERLYACLEAWAAEYQRTLYSSFGAMALKYLRDTRGLTDDTIRAARIGYAPFGAYAEGFTEQENINSGRWQRDDEESKPYEAFRNRIMIPLIDHKGRVVGFSGRDMGNKGPKYKNTGKTEIFIKGSLVYTPTSRVKNTQGQALDTLVVVEGHMDAISALNTGFDNVRACMGTALTDEQIKLLCRGGLKRLVLCFDNDAAGESAMRKGAAQHLHTAARLGVDLLIMRPPHGKDPDDTFREKPALWQPAVDAARPVVDVLLDLEFAALHKDASAMDRRDLAKRLMPVLKSDDPILTEDNLKKLALRLGYTLETITSFSKITLLPKANSLPMQRIETHLPTNEEWVLHAILVNDDDHWFERASAALDTVTTESYAYALAPLSINDFTHKDTHMIMGQITRLVKEGQRPLHETVKAYFMGSNNNVVYERIEATEHRSRILGGPGALDYGEFIRLVFDMRTARLRRDIANNPKDAALIRECSNGIALLSLAQETLI